VLALALGSCDARAHPVRERAWVMASGDTNVHDTRGILRAPFPAAPRALSGAAGAMPRRELLQQGARPRGMRRVSLPYLADTKLSEFLFLARDDRNLRSGEGSQASRKKSADIGRPLSEFLLDEPRDGWIRRTARPLRRLVHEASALLQKLSARHCGLSS